MEQACKETGSVESQHPAIAGRAVAGGPLQTGSARSESSLAEPIPPVERQFSYAADNRWQLEWLGDDALGASARLCSVTQSPTRVCAAAKSKASSRARSCSRARRTSRDQRRLTACSDSTSAGHDWQGVACVQWTDEWRVVGVAQRDLTGRRCWPRATVVWIGTRRVRSEHATRSQPIRFATERGGGWGVAASQARPVGRLRVSEREQSTAGRCGAATK